MSYQNEIESLSDLATAMFATWQCALQSDCWRTSGWCVCRRCHYSDHDTRCYCPGWYESADYGFGIRSGADSGSDWRCCSVYRSQPVFLSGSCRKKVITAKCHKAQYMGICFKPRRSPAAGSSLLDGSGSADSRSLFLSHVEFCATGWYALPYGWRDESKAAQPNALLRLVCAGIHSCRL